MVGYLNEKLMESSFNSAKVLQLRDASSSSNSHMIFVIMFNTTVDAEVLMVEL